jgi:hypothetical protein
MINFRLLNLLVIIRNIKEKLFIFYQFSISYMVFLLWVNHSLHNPLISYVMIKMISLSYVVNTKLVNKILLILKIKATLLHKNSI